MEQFRSKARAVELLGKGQIADLPTAISEYGRMAMVLTLMHNLAICILTIDGDLQPLSLGCKRRHAPIELSIMCFAMLCE